MSRGGHTDPSPVLQLFLPQRGRMSTRGQRATFPALLSLATGEGEGYPINRLNRSGKLLPHHPLRGSVRFAPLLPAKPATGSFCFGKSPRWGKHRRVSDRRTTNGRPYGFAMTEINFVYNLRRPAARQGVCFNDYSLHNNNNTNYRQPIRFTASTKRRKAALPSSFRL